MKKHLTALSVVVVAAGCTDVRVWKAGQLERVSVELERPEPVEPEETWGFVPKPGEVLRYTVGDVFCTPPSEEITVPFKLLIIMDYSGSMQQNDPQQLRLQAVADLITRYANDPSVYFGFLPFSDQNRPLPSLGMDFTNDPNVLANALTELGNVPSQGATNYQDALAWAWDAITIDIDRDENIPGTRYGILFVTDGRPNEPEQGGADAELAANRPKIRDRITACDGFHVNRPLESLIEFLNTYFLAVQPDPAASQLLRDMAEGPNISDPCGNNNWGHGEFTEVQSAADLEFDINLPTFRQVLVNRGGFLFQNHNLKAVFRQGNMVMARDSDGDGIPDYEETANPIGLYDSDIFSGDTDGDGIGDLAAYSRGLPTNQPQPVPETYPRPPIDPDLAQYGMLYNLGPYLANDFDDDGDGLTNREEDFLGTDQSLFDTDADSLSDIVELRYGLNPLVAADAALDSDGDGRDNKTEIEVGLDPFHAEPQDFIDRHAYRIEYGNETVIEIPNPMGGRPAIRSCYDFRIDNITYQPPLRKDGTLGDFNLFELSFIDQPRVPIGERELVLRRTIVKASPDVDGPDFYFRRQLPQSW